MILAKQESTLHRHAQHITLLYEQTNVSAHYIF